MFLSLSHPYPHFSSKPPDDSPFPLFLSPSSSKTSLRFQNPKPPKSLLRSSLPKPTTTTTATDTVAKSAIQRIAEKLRSLGYLDENQINPSDRPHTGPGSAGEIFIPTPHEIPKHRVGHTIDSSWSTPENPTPEPGSGTTITRFHEIRREGKGKVVSPSPEAVPTVAELMIPAEELKRLRSVGIRLEKRLKVGKPGITEGIVNGIHERWRRSELVKIKCEDLCRMNMKRTHETLERKTGGLVVWRSGSIIILFRGANYKYPYFYDGDKRNESLGPGTSDGAPTEQEENSFFAIAPNPSAESSYPSARSLLIAGVGSPKKVRFQQPGEVQLEEEADQLLDGLGPRFTDWWGCDPLPVDADLLPAIVPGYRKPFRLLPFGVKPKLTDREMTILRRLGRPLPCHFAVGRNRKLQGLALSMIKLWEKCEVAKIAVKRGVQNTNTEIMVEELKQLTGGTLLSRDKEFIVFYRGKDFLPPAVSIAIEERRNYDNSKQKQKAYENSSIATTPAFESGFAVEELQEVNEKKELLAMGTRVKSANLALKRVDTKLSQTLEKKEKAEKLLVKLEKSVEPPITESDREAISEEERYMLRRVGLRMKPFLLLGRRGVFDGTVENMHLHWKYRELVKIISKDRGAEDVQRAARTLEAESGGILVAVERVNKGHAIIVYRGKNYRRPADLRPRTLLNKREAMKRSLEAQRSESLKLHVLSLSRNIDQLKHQLMKDDSVVDSMQLTERTRSSTGFETGDCNVSAERDHNRSAESAYHQENTEEVHEADAEILHSDECACSSSDTAVTVNTSTNVTESTVPVGYMEDRFVASKHEDELPKTEVVQSFSQPGFSAHIPLKEMGYIFDESASHPVQQGQTSCLAKNNSHIPAKDSIDLSLGASQGEPNSSVHEDEMEVESNVTFSFKASPLSNRERLILRKQALKMKKRPVLAVGRSNVLTGVAKTIKTHFQKYPLAIVNIKGMAKGTSIQEVIFELEQATGAVLVSREPNKVILYRGWGEGEEPGGPKEKDARKTSRGVKEVVSPELMAAIKLECGLQGNQVE